MQKYRILCTLGLLLLLNGCAAEPDAAAQNAPVQEAASQAEADTDTAAAETAATPVQSYVSPFPDLLSFTAQTSDGAAITETEFARADVTAINIWQTTCPPCISEMPELAELEASLPEHVQFMTWCLDGAFYADTTKSILQEANFMGITIVSGDGDLSALASGLMYTPTTIFVDSSGHIIGQEIIGAPADVQVYRDGINQALQQIGKDTI